jgi:hypothetical protein
MPGIKYKSRLVALIIILSASPLLNAKDIFRSPDPEFIIESCKEVIEIYKSRDEKKFLASQRTSLAEGLRAGYCIGLLTMTACERSYSKNDWMKAAILIAGLDPRLEENRRAKPMDILVHGRCK